jgi:hypothetical protein
MPIASEARNLVIHAQAKSGCRRGLSQYEPIRVRDRQRLPVLGVEGVIGCGEHERQREQHKRDGECQVAADRTVEHVDDESGPEY